VERFDDAITAHQQAAKIYRETGDQHREAGAWNNLGLALWRARRFDEAITAYEGDITICVEFGDQYGHAWKLESLGAVHAALGHPELARRAWAEALEFYTRLGTHDDADQVRRWLAALDDR
jgi:tetratricopeptide (TPR) repeat protein